MKIPLPLLLWAGIASLCPNVLFAAGRLPVDSCVGYSSLYREWLPKLRVSKGKPDERAIAVLVHGFAPPSSMDALAEELSKAGITAIEVGLRGFNDHEPVERSLPGVSFDDWANEVLTIYCGARDLADQAGVPFYMLGHSTGGLLLEEVLKAQWTFPRFRDPIRVDKLVLLAPLTQIRAGAFGTKTNAIIHEVDYMASIKAPASNLPTLVLPQPNVDSVRDFLRD